MEVNYLAIKNPERPFSDNTWHYIVSHLGHSTGPHTKYQKDPDRLYSLHEQIQHKIRCFDILRSENAADTKFILMGHSIGAYICAEVLKKRQDQGIERLIALFPTLREIALTPNGVSISVSLCRFLLITNSNNLSISSDWYRRCPKASYPLQPQVFHCLQTPYANGSLVYLLANLDLPWRSQRTSFFEHRLCATRFTWHSMKWRPSRS